MKQWVCSYWQVHRADKVLLFFKKIEEFDCLRFECRWIEQANEKEETKNEKASGLLSKNNKKNWKKELQSWVSQTTNLCVLPLWHEEWGIVKSKCRNEEWQRRETEEFKSKKPTRQIFRKWRKKRMTNRKALRTRMTVQTAQRSTQIYGTHVDLSDCRLAWVSNSNL